MEESQVPRPAAAPQLAHHDAQLDRFSPDERDDIYRRAAQIEADTLFRDDDSWSAQELQAGARGAGISDAALKTAIAERERDLERQQQEKIVAQKQSSELRHKLLIGAVAVVAIGGITTWATQAKLSGSYAQVESTRAQIDNNLQRRHDLVPNLISVTQKTLDNQSALSAQLKRANAAAMNAAPAQKVAAEKELSAAIGAATAQLGAQDNASDNVRDLVAELAGSENRLAQSRHQFNNAAAQYNQKARGFPTMLVRPILGYPSRIEPLQADVAAREVPKFN